MAERITFTGTYEPGTGHSSGNWSMLANHHREDFPAIDEMASGTFNVRYRESFGQTFPEDVGYRRMAKGLGQRDGNHIAPTAKVVEINGIPVEAWIYRGGAPIPKTLELICRQRLSASIGLQQGDEVRLVIERVDEGTEGMPKPPSVRVGPPRK